MSRLPSVGVATSITNPLTTCYYSYLAFVESWLKVADEVIVIDGGSTDESLDFLCGWIGNTDKLRVIRNEVTYWGEGDRWHAEQLSINLNLAMGEASADWLFLLGADHIVDTRTATGLRQELADFERAVVAVCFRGKPEAGVIRHKLDSRSYAVNLRLLRSRGIQAVQGTNQDSGLGSDWVLRPVHKSLFKDPVTGTVKRIYRGPEFPVEGHLSLECVSFGHFFFDVPTAVRKMCRWDRANARYLGIAPARELEHRMRTGLFGINRWLKRAELAGMDGPEEAARVIQQFYEPGMIGGAVRRVPGGQQKAAFILRKLLGGQRHLRTAWMRARGYRGLKERHIWVPMEAPDPEPLDVRTEYQVQDRLLPQVCRIDWGEPLTSPGRQGS